MPSSSAARKLFKAARIGDLEVIDALLSRFPEAVQHPDYDPVASAVRAGQLEAARKLLVAGASMDRGGLMELAVAGEHLEIAKLLARAGVICDAWHAAALGWLSQLEVLVDKDESLLRDRREGYSLLHAAAAFRRDQVVAWLIEGGCEVDARNAVGLTPLSLAVGKRVGGALLSQRLLEAGASPDVDAVGGGALLYRAVELGDRELANVLLAAGADPERTGPGGETARALLSASGWADYERAP